MESSTKLTKLTKTTENDHFCKDVSIVPSNDGFICDELDIYSSDMLDYYQQPSVNNLINTTVRNDQDIPDNNDAEKIVNDNEEKKTTGILKYQNGRLTPIQEQDKLSSTEVFLVLDDLDINNIYKDTMTIEISNESNDKTKDKTNTSPARKVIIKKEPLSDYSNQLHTTKKRLVEEIKSKSLDNEPKPSTSKSTFKSSYSYPQDYKNDTNPGWNRYKRTDISHFEIVQKEWGNPPLVNPNEILSCFFLKSGEKKTFPYNFQSKNLVKVTEIYDKEIEKLSTEIDDLVRNTNTTPFRKRNFIRNRIEKLENDISNYKSAKKQLSYVVSKYKNEKFDANFIDPELFDFIVREKEKIKTYEEIYGRSE